MPQSAFVQAEGYKKVPKILVVVLFFLPAHPATPDDPHSHPVVRMDKLSDRRKAKINHIFLGKFSENLPHRCEHVPVHNHFVRCLDNRGRICRKFLRGQLRLGQH